MIILYKIKSMQAFLVLQTIKHVLWTRGKYLVHVDFVQLQTLGFWNSVETAEGQCHNELLVKDRNVMTRCQ